MTYNKFVYKNEKWNFLINMDFMSSTKYDGYYNLA